MNAKIFIEINKFDKWAQTQSDITQDDRGGEWECGYDSWDDIYQAFANYLKTSDPTQWTSKEKELLLYIIARDNEMEHLSSILDEQALVTLTREAIINGHRDDKWQLAVQLNRLTDKHLATTLMDSLVNDEDEYVNRRALMGLAELQSDRVEGYAEVFWSRNKYGDMDEYQKMAVLHALSVTKSKNLEDYIRKAKEDGREHLVNLATKIEDGKNYR
jgi:hypothetical protein